MRATVHQIDLATIADGSCTAYSIETLSGRILQVRYAKTDFADGSTITATLEDSGVAIWAETGVNASATRVPTQATHTTAGVAATFDGTRAVLAPVVVDGERIKVVVASGGDTKTGTLYVWIG